MTTTNLTTAQVEALEETIERRMINTGESREEACEHIANYIFQTIKDYAN